MSLSRGIDVSHHQGVIAWPTLAREHGLSWAACKASEGLTFTDSQFAANWAGIKAAGLVRMAYHFARPGSDPYGQAHRFVSLVRPQPGDVLCLDLEASDGKSQGQVNTWAKRFATTVRQLAPGNTLVLYVGGYAANGSGAGLSAYFDYWWYPRYATKNPVRSWPTSYAPRLAGNTTGWSAPHIWQWAESLVTSEGQVDANVSPLTAAQLRDGPRKPSTTPDVAPAAPTDGLPTHTEANMVIIRKEKGYWYLSLGGTLIGLYAGQSLPPAEQLPRLGVTEQQWARILKSGVKVVY